MNARRCLVNACAAIAAVCVAAERRFEPDAVKSLAGDWRVTGTNLSGVVRLPGTLADAKLGRLTTAADWEKDADRRSKGALTRTWQYRGKAVYERAIELTEEEACHPLELVMERVMLHSELSVDGETVGSIDSLAVEHIYPIPQRLTKPGRHTIRLTLDNSNRYNFSEWAHSYGPVMQSVWHGVVGEIALWRQNPLRQSRVFASWPANGKLLVEVPGSFKADSDGIRYSKFTVPAKEASFEVLSIKPSPYRKGFNLVELKLDREPEPWSEHHPNLYVLKLRDKAAGLAHQIRFGFRSVSAHDHAIWVNGVKWFMRGNLDCCHFPLTGAPDTTKAWWLGTFRRLRDEDGINTIRFHSWTPPKAAFDAADELGMLCAVEAGIWKDGWMRGSDNVGYGRPIDGFVQRELRAVLERRGNSPSFISFGIGNELGGNDFKTMDRWMNDCKSFDPRRLYLVSTARAVSAGDDYTTTHNYPGLGAVRARFRPSTDWDYEDVYGRTGVPAVAHEIGQWPIYVDWKHELPKYTGVMRPYNLEHYRDVAVKTGTERHWPRFCKASARLNRLMYKDEVESFLRTPSCAGLQLLSAQDFTGQFEAMIGWRDSFYDLKPSVKALPPFRDVFNSLPHLARFEKYVWRAGETYKAKLVLRNITEEAIPEGTELECSIVPQVGQNVLFSSAMRLAKTLNPGEVGVAGEVSLPLTEEMAGRKFMLKFGRNSWPFWVFGGAVSAKPPHVLETASFDEAVAALSKGGKVLYTGPSARSSKAHFKPVYWSTGHFRNANAEFSTLGYSIRAEHPALRGFPTEDWADWQWYNLVEGGVKHGVAGLPPVVDPIVMPVPDLHYSTPMGMLFEMKVGEGRLMACGLNLSDTARPEVCAMRKSILSYMESDAFNPAASVEAETFKEAFAPPAAAAKMRPAQFRDATVYIAAAVNLDVAERSFGWKKALDFAEMGQGGYTVSGKGHWGIWRDATGSFWHGQGLSITLTDARPVTGTLWVRFRDPNRNNRSGHGTCEGRPFPIPRHQDEKDGIWWAKLRVMREDFLDGKIELSCEAATGPNLMIDRIALMADK